MSTLVAQTISNGTISTSTANVINGAKAWVNFNGTGTVAIRGSYNVSSITDNGTGDYTINFTNAMPNANYSATAMCVGWDLGLQGGLACIYGNRTNSNQGQTASSLRIITGPSNAGALFADDFFGVNIAIFR